MPSRHISVRSSPQALQLLRANPCRVSPKGRSRGTAQGSHGHTLTRMPAEQWVSVSKSSPELAKPQQLQISIAPLI